MTGGSHIIAIGPEDTPPATQAETTSEGEDVLALDEEWEDSEAPGPRHFGWIVPCLAVLTVFGWTAFFGFAHKNELLAGGGALQWSEWIIAWSAPVLLVVALWLLIMRSSSREATRFGDAARLLSQESLQLETRLVTVNRELSLARDFIAAQSRDLESLGRVASERLSENADRLSDLIRENGDQIESIASVSTTAMDNMNKLRGELPVIANSARDVTSQIGNAGRTAHTQLDELVSGFHRLNEFGEASERQVQSLRIKVDAALTAFEAQASQLDDIASSRFDALGERSQAFRAELDNSEVEAHAAIRRRADALTEDLNSSWNQLETRESEALSALRTRLTALRDESESLSSAVRDGESEAISLWGESIKTMHERLTKALEEVAEIDASSQEKMRSHMNALREEGEALSNGIFERSAIFMTAIECRRSEHEVYEAETTAALENRLANLDSAVNQRQEDQLVHVAALTDRGDALAAQLGTLSERISQIAAEGGQTGDDLNNSIESLSVKFTANQNILKSTDQAIADLTDASVRLLEIIQAGSQHSKEQLPSAIKEAQIHLDHFEQQTKAVSLLLNDASDKGQALSEYVLTAKHESRAALEGLDVFHQGISEHQKAHVDQLESLRGSLKSLTEESESLSQRAQGDMSNSVSKLEETLRSAIIELKNGSGPAIAKFAERIGSESSDAIDRALRLHSTEAIGELEQAAAHASGVGRESARQLRDQLTKVAVLTDNLEARISQARGRAEEQVDNDFSRRMALITESLNSNAIDLTKVLSNDITDTAWASYLRGDRGIFTRRAVRLLDNSEAREIAEIYENDHDFREHVSRYIHDFEAMLRTMLSTRDGNALGVTLLSSDMGKLYVALAQAIERLRD